MLVLTRKVGEEIVIDGCIRIKVTLIQGNQVRLGIDAPPDMEIWRKELLGEWDPMPDAVEKA